MDNLPNYTKAEAKQLGYDEYQRRGEFAKDPFDEQDLSEAWRNGYLAALQDHVRSGMDIE